MADPRLLQTRDVRLDDIDVSGRLRPASDAGIASIMASIEELGTTLSPVMLRDTGDKLVLIGGLHRLEACRRLGRETIRADIWSCSAQWARLAEIDENLADAGLSSLELAQFLAERKRVYERLHPETKAGFAGAAALHNNCANDTVSFASSISEKRGISKRQVQRLVRIGGYLDGDAARLLQTRESPPTYRELESLAALAPEAQRRAAELVTTGGARTLKAAIVEAGPGMAPRKALNADEAALRKLIDGFERAPKLVQTRFLEHLAGTDKYVAQMVAALNSTGAS